MICKITLEKPFDIYFPNILKNEKSDLDFLRVEDRDIRNEIATQTLINLSD